MEQLTHRPHQNATDECKKDQFCDNNLVSYESTISEHADSDSVDQAVTNDFTINEDVTSHAESLMTRKQIEEALDQILADVKIKRDNDLKILSDVKKEVMAQAARSCDMLEQYMNHMHAMKSKEFDQQIVLLMNTLSKSHKLESEMDHFKTSLSLLCKDITSSDQFI